MPEAATTDVEVTFTASAIDAHREARELITRAYAWAEDLSFEDAVSPKGPEILEERRKLAIEMELSYLRNLAHITTMSQGWDGPLKVFRDSEACMFWRHEKSGYCGGLNFHRNHKYSKPGEPLTLGTWSVNT